MNSDSGVNDKWIFLFVYPVMAIAVVHIGNDNSFLKLMSIPSYYTDLLLSFSCTFGLGFYLRNLFRKIDQKFSWEEEIDKRIRSHVIRGILIPAFIIITIEILYLIVIDIQLNESSVFYLELPLVLLFCLLINLIYFILYYRKYNFKLKDSLEKEGSKSIKESFLSRIGSQTFQIRKDDIAYFIVQDKITFLVTVQNKRYLHDASLKELRSFLSAKDFFQINRQVIASRHSVITYSQTNTRRLEIKLTPPLEEPVFLAKEKVSEFVEWLKQN